MLKVFALLALTSTLGFSNSSDAAHLTMSSIVVGVDYSDINPVVSYPCSTLYGAVFCGSNMRLAPTCERTLVIKDTSLSCKNKQGQWVEIGQIQKNSFFEDTTLPGTDAYEVKHQPWVRLIEMKTPNGNTEWQVSVD